MPSPFPGMNPYLEDVDVWHDFHDAFLMRAREVLTAQLPPPYVVKYNEYLFIHDPPCAFTGKGDIRVAATNASSGGGTTTASPAAPAQVETSAAARVEDVSYLEIVDRRERRVVVVLELLSPTNKYSGPDREQFLTKRKKILASLSHYVELDLLRGGPRLPFATEFPACDYYALVSRRATRPRGEFWPIQLRDRLPVIPIPLREPDPDAHLDLQAVLHHVYDAARYGNYVYEVPPTPALSPEDQAWARQCLATAPS